MGIKRTSHAVYDTKYHLVWVPKYRKNIFTEKLAKRVKEMFQEISQQYDFEIDIQEVMSDHVHLFLSFPPRYSISQVVQILKCQSASKVFKEFPLIKRELWGGELWNDGYFARTVGDKVTADVIRKYIKYQQHETKSKQLKLF